MVPQTNNSPSAARPCTASSHEARLLAQLLRSSRVVLLLGDLQADRSGLIQDSLLPLLARRSTDRADHEAGSAAGTATLSEHLPERRHSSNHRKECVVAFDRWASGVGGPLQQLKQSLAAALGMGMEELLAAAPQRLDEALAAWTQDRPVHVLLLLDRFEEHLLAPRPEPKHAQVTDELVRLLNRPGLPVSVLLSLTESAQPQLAGMRSLVPGLEDMSLRLKGKVSGATGRDAYVLPMPALPAGSTAGPTHEADTPAAMKTAGQERVDARRAAADRPAIRSDDVYALINSTLSRVSTGSSANPMMGVRPEHGEPEIEAFQPAQQTDVFAQAAPIDTFPADLQNEVAAVEPRPGGQAASIRIGWWRRLMRLLGSRA